MVFASVKYAGGTYHRPFPPPHPPQLIAIILSSLLFVKYIFLDKSETFPYSNPPSPVHVNGKLASATQQKAYFSAPHQASFSAQSCPFVLTATSGSDSSLVANGNSPLAINHAPPDTDKGTQGLRTGMQPPKSMEKLVRDGIVLKTGGEITRNRSNSRLQQLLPSAEVSIPPEPAPVQCASVGTQTESVGVESPVFTVGGVERKDSLPAAAVSEEPHPPSELPLVPRQVEQCLAILKSDVST